MQTISQTLKQVATIDNINDFSDRMANEMMNGITDPIEMYAQMKFYEEAFDKARKKTKDLIFKKVESLGQDTQHFGFDFKNKEKRSFKFEKCGCSEWTALRAAEKCQEIERKELEKQLKSIPDGKIIISEDTGEIWNAPEITYDSYVELRKIK